MLHFSVLIQGCTTDGGVPQDFVLGPLRFMFTRRVLVRRLNKTHVLVYGTSVHYFGLFTAHFHNTSTISAEHLEKTEQPDSQWLSPLPLVLFLFWSDRWLVLVLVISSTLDAA